MKIIKINMQTISNHDKKIMVNHNMFDNTNIKFRKNIIVRK